MKQFMSSIYQGTFKGNGFDQQQGHGSSPPPPSSPTTALYMFHVKYSFATALGHNPARMLAEMLEPLRERPPKVHWVAQGRCILKVPTATPPTSAVLWNVAAIITFPASVTEHEIHELGASICSTRCWMAIDLCDPEKITQQLLEGAEQAAEQVKNTLEGLQESLASTVQSNIANQATVAEVVDATSQAMAEVEKKTMPAIKSAPPSSAHAPLLPSPSPKPMQSKTQGWSVWNWIKGRVFEANWMFRFLTTSFTGPIAMLNIVSFRDEAAAEMFLMYMANTLCVVKQLGPDLVDAKITMFGVPKSAVHSTMEGPAGPEEALDESSWDLVFCSWYKSKQHLTRLLFSSGYRRRAKWRTQALADSLVMACNEAADNTAVPSDA